MRGATSAGEFPMELSRSDESSFSETSLGWGSFSLAREKERYDVTLKLSVGLKMLVMRTMRFQWEGEERK